MMMEFYVVLDPCMTYTEDKDDKESIIDLQRILAEEKIWEWWSNWKVTMWMIAEICNWALWEGCEVIVHTVYFYDSLDTFAFYCSVW